MVCVVPPAGVPAALSSLAQAGLTAWQVGEVVAVEAQEARYSES
jgi:phosphoribosylaminoimidazole (AIR) synthetase